MTITDIATAAQSLADYCYREGEGADLRIVAGQIRLIAERADVVQMDRTRDMVTK